MRAATIREQEIVIEEHPDPVAQAGEVLVRVHAAGLNGADMMQRRGLYPAPPGSPQDIPGMELAGEVVALGPHPPGAERFVVGERVMAIVGGGGQAELATVHERQLMPVPDALDWPAAGGLPCTGKLVADRTPFRVAMVGEGPGQDDFDQGQDQHPPQELGRSPDRVPEHPEARAPGQPR